MGSFPWEEFGIIVIFPFVLYIIDELIMSLNATYLDTIFPAGRQAIGIYVLYVPR